jgi:arylformamidase
MCYKIETETDMKIYDCSRLIKEGMTIYPGDMPAALTWVRKPEGKMPISQTAIEMGMHTGTHVDTPLHFIPEGKNLDEVPLDRFIGRCRLIEVPPDKDMIGFEDVEPYDVQAGEIILFKTRNSDMPEDAPFIGDFVTLNTDAAKHLAERGVKTVGIDYLSVDNNRREGIHFIVLGAGMCIIEGLYFKNVPPGSYFLSALPLRVATAEGCPVRAVLLSDM